MNKRGLAFETIAKWVIAIVVLIVVLLSIAAFIDKGGGAIEYAKNFIRFKG